MIILKSSDGVDFEVEEAVAVQSGTIKKHMLQQDNSGHIPLDLTSETLAKVIEYLERHAYATEDEDFDAAFVQVGQNTLFELIIAAYILDINNLLDLTCQTLVGIIKNKTPDEIRLMFSNDDEDDADDDD